MLATLLLAATLSVEDYATMPQPGSVQWAPDGKRIAYVVTRADLERSVYDSDVWLVDADGARDRRLTYGPGVDANPRWSPDGSRIAFLSDRAGKPSIFIMDADGGEARPLTKEPSAIREMEWSPDGAWIAFTRADAPTADEEKRTRERDDARVVDDDRKPVHLYLAGVASGEVRRLTDGDFSVFTFSWSPDGKEIAYARAPRQGLDGLYDTDVYAVSTSGETRPVVVRPGIDHAPVWSPDGTSIAFRSGGGTAHWIVEHDVYVVGAGGGAPRRVSAAYGRTPDAVGWDDDSQSLWIEGAWNTTGQLFRVNADGTGFTNVTRVDGVVSDVDVHGDRAAYVFQSLTEPPELYVDGLRLTHHNDAYRDRELGETRLIRWKNPKDGLEIEGLLTLPVGYVRGTRVPLLTFMHGGPASYFSQELLGYLGHVYAPQTLAARGFAVLRPNPRGSGAYGLAFRRANRGDWGGLDWIDINAGIDSVIAAGIADPKRLGLMGWSYGGFLAAWALGHSDRFRAVSIGAPVVDLLSHHGTSDIRGFIPAYFEGMDRDALRAHSPAWQLEKTKAKVLIQQGENDERVPLAQGMMLYRLLQDLDADVTMVVYPRTSHVAREPKLRIDVARRNVDLFTNTFGTPASAPAGPQASRLQPPGR